MIQQPTQMQIKWNEIHLKIKWNKWISNCDDRRTEPIFNLKIK